MIEEQEINGVLLLSINLRHATLEKAKVIKDFLHRKIDSGEKKIVIDCNQILYMDSTFLGALVVSLKKTASQGGDLRLVMGDVNSPVWTMFETTRMFKVFKTFDDVQKALDSFE